MSQDEMDGQAGRTFIELSHCLKRRAALKMKMATIASSMEAASELIKGPINAPDRHSGSDGRSVTNHWMRQFENIKYSLPKELASDCAEISLLVKKIEELKSSLRSMGHDLELFCE